MLRSLVDFLRRTTLAAGLLFLAALVIAAPIVAALQWGLAGLLTFLAIAVAWRGGMFWQSIRSTPNDRILAKHAKPTFKDEDWRRP